MWCFKEARAKRLFELEHAVQYMPATGRVLEIGAGAGWQASALAERGYEVIALDVPNEEFAALRAYREFDVQDYDGAHLPFADGYFDVIFSSTVLEHVEDLDTLLGEMKRVVQPKGVCVHVLPTSAWRWWTSVGHYVYALKRLVQIPFKNQRVTGTVNQGLDRYVPMTRRKTTALEKIQWWLFPERHGVKGNWFTEAFWFSQRRWRSRFHKSGYTLLTCQPLGLFYSGIGVFGLRLSLKTRARYSRFLGSGSRLYVLEPRESFNADADRHEILANDEVRKESIK